MMTVVDENDAYPDGADPAEIEKMRIRGNVAAVELVRGKWREPDGIRVSVRVRRFDSAPTDADCALAVAIAKKAAEEHDLLITNATTGAHEMIFPAGTETPPKFIGTGFKP